MTTPGSPGRISRRERTARAAIGMPARVLEIPYRDRIHIVAATGALG
jgi:hypothetical protein